MVFGSSFSNLTLRTKLLLFFPLKVLEELMVSAISSIFCSSLSINQKLNKCTYYSRSRVYFATGTKNKYSKTPNSAVNWDRENAALSENRTVTQLSLIHI